MSNSSLRERFSLPDEDYQAVSAVIGEAIRAQRIIPADPDQGKRNARYVPYWVGTAAFEERLRKIAKAPPPKEQKPKKATQSAS